MTLMSIHLMRYSNHEWHNQSWDDYLLKHLPCCAIMHCSHRAPFTSRIWPASPELLDCHHMTFWATRHKLRRVHVWRCSWGHANEDMVMRRCWKRCAHEAMFMRTCSWRGAHEEVLMRTCSWGNVDDNMLMRRCSWEGAHENMLMRRCSSGRATENRFKGQAHAEWFWDWNKLFVEAQETQMSPRSSKLSPK